MLDLSEYTIPWLIYVAASAGLLLVSWRVFRGVPWRYVRQLLLLTVAVILLTPVMGNENFWAPAWVIAALEAFFGDLELAASVGKIIVIIWGVVIVLYTIISRVFFKRQPVSSGSQRHAKKVVS